MAQPDDGPHDLQVLALGRDTADEGPVDLDAVDGQLLQVAQRREARTKIVQVHPHAELLERAESAAGEVMILHQNGLGDLDDQPLYDHMYWSMGQIILKGAAAVEKHPQLFGAFITNFSCGPDSFIIGYFRELMASKPSLTLELDDHTADAGLETRIEAFLDIVDRHRGLEAQGRTEPEPDLTIASLHEGMLIIATPDGESSKLTDERIHLLIPSMGQYNSQALAAACRGFGVKASCLPAMSDRHLTIGKGNSLCKECLPLQLTTGALLDYLESRRDPKEVTVYFMPTARGPCRFGQYQIFLRNLIRRHRIPRVALLSLSAEDNYGGLGVGFLIRGWYATIIADCFQDMRHEMLVSASDPKAALAALDSAFREIIETIENQGMGRRQIVGAIRTLAADLERVPRSKPAALVPRVLMVGEIYVRQEDISRQWIPEFLAEHGIATHVAPLHEWFYYLGWLRKHGASQAPPGWRERLGNQFTRTLMRSIGRQVKRILGRSGWYLPRFIDMDHLMEIGGKLISTELYGEAILTVAGPLAEVGTDFCGAIAIGPFGCMPNRLSEAVLSGRLDAEHVLSIRDEPELRRVFESVDSLPFLSVESDGGVFPQTTKARLETFVLQALRLHEVMRETSSTKPGQSSPATRRSRSSP